MLKLNRSSWFASAAVAAVVAGTCTMVARTPARADEPMSGTQSGMASADLKQAAMKCSTMMKEEADSPDKMDAAKVKMAKAMLMDKMAMQLARDPEFQQQMMADMKDPSVMKTHDAAKQMCEDPAEMKKMEEQIEQDPEAMTVLTHNAAMMSMKGKVGDTMGQMK